MPTPLTVLLVEDSESDAQLVIRMLKKGDYEPNFKVVETAEDMRASLQQKPWDVVISDYNLPHFDGHAALEILKDSGLDIPFIAVSGAMGEETAVAMMKAGAHDYMMKDKLARLVPAIERELRESDSRKKRKRAEEELQKLQNLQSIGTLAGGIAHDFNNILMLLYLNISMAKDELDLDHPSQKYLEDAENTMNRAIRLTQGLLTFAQGGDPIREDACLGTLVEEAAKVALAGSNVRLVFQGSSDLWVANVDKAQIQQVISNLTINARQAMSDGGRIFIVLENANIAEDTVPGLHKGCYVKVTVRDEGTGIAQKNLARIFDPYFTTRKNCAGLGLATAYSVVHKHGGHIGVVSEFGKGTTMTLYLPATGSSKELDKKQPATLAMPTDHTAKVLVMDDEEDIRVIVATMLKRCGFRAESASDGREAVEMYRQALEANDPYDVVIMDLCVPGGVGGKEAIQELRVIDPHVRAVISSGYNDDPVMADYIKHGFMAIAPKPYTSGKLREIVAQVMAARPA